ncbi:MAG TPA: HD domain-containing protein [Candidatus Saccharimonadales bacterium]|nr:HD domain-containing protein [Candidatus Saccharimonadales bacterium]
MVLRDRIYGRIAVTEPVIAELIASKPLQRLKHISQDGASHFIYPSRDVTRFEHSVGAWYLARYYKRPVEEQIACLLHDVPHTAFSHVIDTVIPSDGWAYHDQFLEKVVMRSEIPDICRRHRIDIAKVLDKEQFPLLENDLPDISFDRLDYFMRDGYGFGLLPRQTVKLFLTSLKEKHEQFYFEDVRIASLYAILYLNFCRLLWLDPTSHGAYQLLAGAIKTAWETGGLAEEDFFATDEQVWQKLQAAHDPQIDRRLERLRPGYEFRYAAEAEAEFYGRSKPRIVDPLVQKDGELVRLTTLIPGLAYYFEEFRGRYQYIGAAPQSMA